MKIRLLGQGYDAFTGMFGTVEFVDGVSVGEVSGADARFFAALMPIENVDDGKDPGENARFQKSLNLEAVTVNLPTLAQIQAQQKQELPDNEVEGAGNKGGSDVVVYTKESLEEIADKGGIAALREIGSKLEIKGTSIAGLIEAILVKQAPAVAETDTEVTTQKANVEVDSDPVADSNEVTTEADQDNGAE